MAAEYECEKKCIWASMLAGNTNAVLKLSENDQGYIYVSGCNAAHRVHITKLDNEGQVIDCQEFEPKV
jgi:hypothetical protein